MKKNALAIFDMDGTLTARNSFTAFIKRTHSGLNIFGKAILLSPYLLLFFLRLYDGQKMKERVLKILYKGWTKDALAKAGDSFGEEKIPQILRSDVYQRMKAHREQGHEIVILSASCSVWLNRWAANEKIKLIASEMEYENGMVTGKISGKNCRGPEKKIRLEAEYDLSSFDRIYAYGDSPGDRFYMDLAHEKYYIGSKPVQWKPL